MQKPGQEQQQLIQERIVMMAQNPYENNQQVNVNNYQRQQGPTPQQKSSVASSAKPRQDQYKQQGSQSTNTDNSRSEEYNQYDHETGTFRVSQDKFHTVPQQFRPYNDNSKQNWSSPTRTVNHAKRVARSPPNQRSIRDNSTEKYDRKSTSMMINSNSYSRWSNSNGKPDPSILDVN